MCLCTAHVVSYTEAATSGRPTGHGPTSCTASLGGQPLVYSHVPCQCLHYPHIHCIICTYMGWAGGPVVYRFVYPIITAQLYIMKQDADEACAGHCQRRRWSPSPPRSRRAVLRPPPILCPTLCSGQTGGLHRCRLLLIECPVQCLHCLHIPQPHPFNLIIKLPHSACGVLMCVCMCMCVIAARRYSTARLATSSPPIRISASTNLNTM